MVDTVMDVSTIENPDKRCVLVDNRTWDPTHGDIVIVFPNERL